MRAKDLNSFEEAFLYIKAESQSKNEPAHSPTTLSLTQIAPASLLFQPRSNLDVRHIRVLKTALVNNDSNCLDPLIVWWSGKNWRLIDGYHRYEAYKAFMKERGYLPDIPVKVFRGGLNQAITHSIRCNSKNKLPMQSFEKSERAWKLLALNTGMTQKEIYQACGVSKRLVATMASALRALPKDQNPLDLTWKEVLRMKPMSHDGEKIVEEMTAALKKTFGSKAIKYPNYFAEALNNYSHQLAEDLGIELFPEAPDQIALCMLSVSQCDYLEATDPHKFLEEVSDKYKQELVASADLPF